MFKSKLFGSSRPILGDIANKFVCLSTQNNFIKPSDNGSKLVTKSQSANNLDANCNEVWDNEYELKLNSQQSAADLRDKNDPNFVTDYVADIVSYLFAREKAYEVSRYFLDKSSTRFIEARAALVNSLVKKQLKCDLPSEVLFLTVQIIDKYLDLKYEKEEIDLVLLSATAFFIATKYESRSYTQMNLELVRKITDFKYSRSEICKMEVNVLNTLNCGFAPVPLQFLRRYSRLADVGFEEHTLAKYFLEVSLLDFEFSIMKPSYLAACALCLAFKLLKRFKWNELLEKNSTYKLTQLRPGMQKIAQMVLRVNELNFEYKESWKKFNEDNFKNLSSSQELTGISIRMIANGAV